MRLGLTALGGVALAGPAAAAMPNGIPQANQIAGRSSNIQEARWVCNGWGRCWWRPNYWGPRPFWWGAYGYWRPHPWHRWGCWHRW